MPTAESPVNWATSMASLVNQTDKVVIGYSKISGQE